MNYDIAVIGGGPAGMIAAGRAGELGSSVVLIEKNKSLGAKLLVTGKGRCNFTQARHQGKELADKYGKGGRFLLYALSLFGPKETIGFFEKLKVKTKIERGGRVFPKSDRSFDILKALKDYLLKGKVTILEGRGVKRIVKKGDLINEISLQDGEKIFAKKYIIATGGKSYPFLGSTGDGFKWAKELGHTVLDLNPVLSPIKVKEKWVASVQGLSLKNVSLDVFIDGKKKESRFGEMLFAHFGITGPIVLDLSKKVGDFLKKGEVKLLLDLKPALGFEELDERLQRDFLKFAKKSFKNSLDDLLPKKMIGVIINLSKISPEKKVNEITKKERQNLTRLLKSLELNPSGLLGFDKAIVTSGGVSLKEIDSKTMKSKIFSNLYFTGEVLDLDGPTGGYNLQICWSTGYLAGTCAARD